MTRDEIDASNAALAAKTLKPYRSPTAFEAVLNKLRDIKTDGVVNSIQNALPVAPEYMDTPTRQPNPNGFGHDTAPFSPLGEPNYRRMHGGMGKMT